MTEKNPLKDHDYLVLLLARWLEEARQQAADLRITAVFHTETLADQPGLTGEQD
jgi:hypothetical protein